MLNWLKTFLGMGPVKPAQINESARNDAAREELNRLRREELSVGAQLRQGEPVNSFPGIATGAAAKVNSPARSNQARGQAQSVHSSGAYGDGDGDGDFTTSMVVGAATGSAFAGYAVGSSLAGAIAGTSIHQSLLPTFDSCGESCSSTGTASTGCDI